VQKPTATITPESCEEKNGRIESIEIPTDHLSAPIETNIYLPPCYDAGLAHRYPVLIMLHGQADSNNEWIDIGLTDTADQLLGAGLIQPMIIVMPFEVSWRARPDDTHFGEALVEDVVPFIDENYSVCWGRACHAVGGLSRGGNWAVYLGFHYPEVFAVVGAHSSPLFYGEMYRISDLLERSSNVVWVPGLYIDVGSKDEGRQEVLDFVDLLDEAGVSYVFNEYEGRHEESYWSAHVRDYLSWYSSQLGYNPKTSLPDD
jgi:enterochelin esterase-like enzyme